MAENNNECTITKKEVVDQSGNSMTMYDIDGFTLECSVDLTLGTDINTHMKNIRNLQIRDDDVIICAYPKAGTHWVWEVINMLRSKSTQYKKCIKEKLMFELNNLTEIDAEPSPRVLNSHLWVQHLPKQIFEKKTKIIHLARNPKDTAVSYFHHVIGLKKVMGYDGSFNDFLYLFLHKHMDMGTLVDYIIQWQDFIRNNDHPVYSMSYENMIKDPTRHVKEIAAFLDINVSDEFVKQVAEACSFKNMKKANEEYKDDFLKPMFGEGESMYRKGKVGDWKNHFTVAQNEEFDQVMAEKLQNLNLKFVYEL